MLSRLLAAFLACLLLWSSLAGQEPVVLESARQVVVESQAALLGGSVGDHHLDDQPAQSLGEPIPDLSALTASASAPGPLPAHVVPAWPPASLWRSPCLAGLWRPPCTTHA